MDALTALFTVLESHVDVPAWLFASDVAIESGHKAVIDAVVSKIGQDIASLPVVTTGAARNVDTFAQECMRKEKVLQRKHQQFIAKKAGKHPYGLVELGHAPGLHKKHDWGFDDYLDYDSPKWRYMDADNKRHNIVEDIDDKPTVAMTWQDAFDTIDDMPEAIKAQKAIYYAHVILDIAKQQRIIVDYNDKIDLYCRDIKKNIAWLESNANDYDEAMQDLNAYADLSEYGTWRVHDAIIEALERRDRYSQMIDSRTLTIERAKHEVKRLAKLRLWAIRHYADLQQTKLDIEREYPDFAEIQ